jgi:hypothetical protein
MPVVDQSSTVADVQQAVPVAQIDWRLIAKAAGEHGVRYRTNTALLAFLAAIEPALPCKSGEGAGEKPNRWYADAPKQIWLHGIGGPNETTWADDPMPGGEDVEQEHAVGYLRDDLTPDATPTREADDARIREIAATIYAEVADEPLGDLTQRRQAVQDTWHDAVRAALLPIDPTHTREGEVRAALQAIVDRTGVGAPGTSPLRSKWARYPSTLYHAAVAALNARGGA